MQVVALVGFAVPNSSKCGLGRKDSCSPATLAAAATATAVAGTRRPGAVTTDLAVVVSPGRGIAVHRAVVLPYLYRQSG